MLLDFRISNYKSFLEEAVFNMIPAKKQKDLEYSILSKQIENKTYRGLCSSVIYGPNAAGKTTIISAMDQLKQIILKGNILNSKELHSPNVSECILELIPNNTLEKSKPTSFYIKFITENLLIEYDLAMDLGDFLDETYERSIRKEQLKINERIVFNREKTIEFSDLNFLSNYLINGFKENRKSIEDVSKNNLNNTELFLTNGFKNGFSSKLVNIIQNWLENDFVVLCQSNSINMVPNGIDKKNIYAFDELNKAAKLFGIGSNGVAYVISEDDKRPELYSIFENKKTMIPSKIFESYGTQRFVNMLQLLIKALTKGSVLVLDEFDAHIHPMALMNIINIFHNDDININNAQLIFNTHNPIFLDSNLFRRDEIKFVERDEDTQHSIIYSLSDFKTAGKQGVRKVDDYLKHYFLGRYGAIRDIDFSDLFEEIVKKSMEETTENAKKNM